VRKLETNCQAKTEKIESLEVALQGKTIKETNLVRELTATKENLALSIEELGVLKSKFEVIDSNSGVSTKKSDYDKFDIDFVCDLQSKENLKSQLKELKFDLGLLSKIISEQKELDYQSTNIETNCSGDRQGMLKVLQQKLNKRDIYIEKINEFLGKLIKEEEGVFQVADICGGNTFADAAKHFTDNIKKLAFGIEEVKTEYLDSIKKEMSPDWKKAMKSLVLKHSPSSPNDYIEKSRVKILKYLSFDVQKVENHKQVYELPTFNIKYDLVYTGYLIDGGKQGSGKLLYPNQCLFYQGDFHENSIYGSTIKIFYDNKKPLVQIKCDSNQLLSNATGEILFYHPNGVTAFEGLVKEGMKEGFGCEYYENGKLRYQGNFKKNDYHSENAVVYNSYGDNKKFINGRRINRGKIEGVAQLWYNFDEERNGGHAAIYGGLFVNGKLDTSGTDKTTEHYDPIRDCRYIGQYKDGMKHGHGSLFCYDTETVLFEGEWKENIPVKNIASSSDKVVINHRNGKKIFEWHISKLPGGWFGGYCTLFDCDDTANIQYEGKYKAPTLSTIIFGSWELELIDHLPFIPKF
jgi:hypothetical protein